jgi:hypothetical protein
MFKNMKDRDIKISTAIIITSAIGCIIQGVTYLANPMEVNPKVFATYSILYGLVLIAMNILGIKYIKALKVIWNINLAKREKNS